jgi:hypothetical protein
MSRRKRDGVNLTICLPVEVKLWVEQQALVNFNSMNAEIVRTIRSRMQSEQQPEALG